MYSCNVLLENQNSIDITFLSTILVIGSIVKLTIHVNVEIGLYAAALFANMGILTHLVHLY